MRIHCIGIGGAGLSGLARILHGVGHIVTGEDAEEGPFLPLLREAAIPVDVGLGSPLPPGTEMVIRSAAVPAGHPRLADAAERGIPVSKYAEALPLAAEGSRLVGVAGTHGKTTTSALLSHILLEAGRDPSFLVGGNIPHLGGSARTGGGGIFVAEACEYDRSFLHLSPWAAVITNVEADHLDCYRDLDDIVDAFRSFIGRVHPEGIVVIPDGDEAAERAAKGAPCRIERYGIDSAAGLSAEGLVRTRDGTDCRLVRRGEEVGAMTVPIPGRHNVSNALAATVAAEALGLSTAEILDGIRSFRTVDRRFQIVRSDDDLAVVSDYAHHPTEIRTVLDACRQRFGDRRRLIVFQPHQRFRTRVFLDRFAESLGGAGRVLVAPIYGAREEGKNGVQAETLVDRIRSAGGDAAALPDLPRIPGSVAGEVRRGDVVLVLGAGDIYRVIDPIAAIDPARANGTNGAARRRRGSPRGGRRRLRDLTSFRLGGPIATYRRPTDLSELQAALREAREKEVPYLCIGGGSNLLARDEGFAGIVIDITGMSSVTASRTRIVAQAGVSLARLGRFAASLSLSGLEPVAGIPGTLGGAVVMNAGGKYGTISDVVEAVGIVLPDGRPIFRRKEEMGFRYRGSDTAGGIVYEVVLRMRDGKRDQIRRRSAEIIRGKRETQPYGVPSAGCIFRNPEGDSAGRLIDAAGLKGARIGGAMVSMLHANFIVNDGGASSRDVLDLITRVQETVRERFDVMLELEVKVV